MGQEVDFMCTLRCHKPFNISYFSKVIWIPTTVHYDCNIFVGNWSNTMIFSQLWDADALVLRHQGISSHSSVYKPMYSQLLIG